MMAPMRRCWSGPGPACYARCMRQEQQIVGVATQGPGLYEITEPVLRFVAESGIGTGLLTAFCRHTSCSLLLQENADPAVKTDLLGFFRRIAPEGMDWIVHDSEGPDDMPAHIKTLVTGSGLNVPIGEGRMLLGTWQGVFLAEHRQRPHSRRIVLTAIGE